MNETLTRLEHEFTELCIPQTGDHARFPFPHTWQRLASEIRRAREAVVEADGTPRQSADYTRGEEKATKQFIDWANRVLDDGDTGGTCTDQDFEALKQRLLALRAHNHGESEA